MWATRDAETLPSDLSAFTPLARVYIREVELNKSRFLNHKNTAVCRNVFFPPKSEIDKIYLKKTFSDINYKHVKNMTDIKKIVSYC